MTYKTVYWDEATQSQKERDCTAEEIADIEERKNAQPNSAEINAPILQQLNAIDLKSIRALREGNAARIVVLEAQASSLRALLIT